MASEKEDQSRRIAQRPDVNPIENLWKDSRAAVNRISPESLKVLPTFFLHGEVKNYKVCVCKVDRNVFIKAVINANGASVTYY